MSVAARVFFRVTQQAVARSYYAGVIANEGGLICDTTTLDHAIQLVGYGQRRDLFGSMVDVWIVRNSWGEDWGYDGYLYLERYSGANTCGIRNAATLVDV